MFLPTRYALASARWAAIFWIATTADAQQGEIVLSEGTVVAASISPGQQDEHRLRIPAGSYVRVAFEPHNCDLVVTVSEHEGAATHMLRTPYGTRNEIIESFLAERAQTVSVRASATKGTLTVCAYQIHVLELRSATSGDQEAISAQADFIEAESLINGTGENRKLALEKFQRATAGYETLARADELGECFRQTARVLMDLNEPPKALEVLNRALILSGTSKSQADEASTLNLLGEAEFDLGHSEKSMEDLTKAAAIRESLGDVRGQVQSLNNLAVVYQELGETRKAFEIHKRLMPLRIATGNRRGEIETLLSLLDEYKVLGDIPNALDTWSHAKELLSNFDDPLLSGEAFLNGGGLFSAMGDKDKALENYLAALEFSRRAGDRQTEAILLSNVANVYLSLGMPEKSLVLLQQSLDIAKAANDPRQQARVLEMMATVSHTLNKEDEAFDLYNKSLAMCISNKDSAWQVLNLNGLGQVDEDRGHLDAALDYFTQALQLVRKIHRPQWEALALANIGHVSTTMGDETRAEASYEEAYTISQGIGDQEMERRILAGNARLKEISGMLDEARKLIEEAIAIAEPIRASVPGNEMRSSYFASIQDLYSLQIEILMGLNKSQPNRGFDILALDASETSRARSLLDRLAIKGRVYQGLDPQLMHREQDLALELSGKRSRLLRLRLGNPQKNAAEIVDLQKEIATREFQYQELQVEIRRKSPRFADLAQPKTSDWKDIRDKVLDSKSALLEYSLGETSSTLWVATHDAVRAFQLPRRKEIEAAALRYYDALTARNRLNKIAGLEQKAYVQSADEQTGKASRILATMILDPAVTLIEGKRLLIVADGALNYVPFAALSERGSAAKPQPLSSGHQIVMLPSASVLAMIRNDRNLPSSTKTVAVLADPVFSTDDSRVHPNPSSVTVSLSRLETHGVEPWRNITDRSATDGSIGLARLPFTRKEADQIYHMAKQGQAMEALDFRATRDIVTSGELANFKILHLATHGLLDDENPALSGLVLSLVDERGGSTDGFLKLQDIYNLRLDADLVVLSACRTALGKDVRGEGIMGLSRAFIYAGAKRVVASLWKVDDWATSELMTRFYHKMLIDGQPPAEALRAAQFELSQYDAWAAPYYWAGFVLQGEAN